MVSLLLITKDFVPGTIYWMMSESDHEPIPMEEEEKKDESAEMSGKHDINKETKQKERFSDSDHVDEDNDGEIVIRKRKKLSKTYKTVVYSETSTDE